MKQKLSLNLEKPVVVFPQLVRLFGDINQAIFWQQIYYWSDKSKDPDNWIYKTKKELEEETALSRDKQDRARKKLEEKGYLETKLIKTNGSPVLHYRVNVKKVKNDLIKQETLISGKPANGKAGNQLMEKRETSYSISGKPANPLYTENTTENTTENNIRLDKPTRRKEISFSKNDYDLVLKEYQALKGIKLNGKEFDPVMQDIKTMFMSKRKPEEIIKFMRWMAEKAKDEDKKWDWTRNWTIKTIRLKLPEFLAGKLERSNADEDIIIPEYYKQWHFKKQ